METISYALATLRLIKWTAIPADATKGTLGREAGQAYGFGTRAQGTLIGLDGATIEGNMSIRVNGQRVDQGGVDATFWCADSFTEQDYNLYRDMKALTVYIETTGDVLNPSSRKLISVEDFNNIDTPIMSDTLVVPNQPRVAQQAQAI